MINEKELKKEGKLLVTSLPNQDYHDGVGYSSTNIKAIFNDVDLYKYELENPKPPSEPMKLGTMFDELIFDGVSFEDKFIVSHEKTKGVKFKKMVLDYPDKNVISIKEEIMFKGMQESLLSNKIFTDIMEGATTQSSYYVTNPITGEIFKVRPDIFKSAFVWDLKTIAEINDSNIKKSIKNYGYDFSLGMYSNGISNFEPVEGAGWIFVCKAPPYQVRFLAMPEIAFRESLDMASNKLERAMAILENGETTYKNEVQEFDWKWRK